MNFVMLRDRTITSRFGHAIAFKKGEPTHVPPVMYEEVMSAGAVPEDGSDELPDFGKKPTREERTEAIEKALTTIQLRAQREDFSADGKPHPRVLSELVGYAVSAKERDTVWATMHKPDDDA